MRDLELQLFNRLWEALTENKVHVPPQHRIDLLCQEIASAGWATGLDIENLVVDMDPRFVDVMMNELKSLAAFLEIPLRNLCDRPAKRQSRVSYLPGLSAADTAALLIGLENLGASVDPSYLVKYVLPGLAKKKRISDSELSVVWFDKVRHKMDTAYFKVHGQTAVSTQDPTKRHWEHRTPTGYKLELQVWGDDEYMWTVASPKHRHRPPKKEITCPECGLDYYKGDLSSTDAHRAEHKRRMYYLSPQPHDKFIATRASDPDPELVLADSPAWKHKEVYIRARAFRREFGYDFTQWKYRRDDDPDVHGYIFANVSGAIVGACAFRLRGNAPSQRWCLQWIWLCPAARRTGVLRQRWPALRARFADFGIEPPVSPAMEAFVRSQGDGHLLD